MDSAKCIQGRSFDELGTESNVVVGQKRSVLEIEEISQDSDRRARIRDLESGFHSEGTGENCRFQPNISTSSSIVDLSAKVETVAPPAANNVTDSTRFKLDLNAEDQSSCVGEHCHPPYSMSDSTLVAVSKEKDSMNIWRGLKKNNYMSNPFGPVPVSIPKACGRKFSNADGRKKKIPLPKKEQTNGFARFSAPSGLLNGLNPGILNHVRNSRQVRSIIENILNSEGNDNPLSGSTRNKQSKSAWQEFTGRKELQIAGSSNPESGKDNKLTLRQTSSGAIDEVSNVDSVTSLSIEAAEVAGQWLELLNHDIRGRLAALNWSKKRVRAVIHTELPLLRSRELSSNPPKDLDQATADVHFAEWNNIFMDMDKALHEEEELLENWLNQVKQVQLHCESGLCRIRRPGETDSMEDMLAVRAAAASMYSMCNYMLSAEGSFLKATGRG